MEYVRDKIRGNHTSDNLRYMYVYLYNFWYW
jgi:hypothetical protein